ncbi:hypothetical protein [uncultured Kocuria sp.]|uniref:hypothetical protein n=1 Tax=uncultured Kocuria sp. TaxID=259305 RepID=UPI0026099DF4|nr:hypothetical protein [uncultured Kocuria sp.]
MAQHRVGVAVCRRMAAQDGLAGALSLGPEWATPGGFGGILDLEQAERALNEAFLWRLRVLAGWLPPTGTGLARAAAGLFEIENVVALARRLDGGGQETPPFDLGTLATAWPRVRTATSTEELARVLDGPPWGRIGFEIDGAGSLRDVLLLAWWRRLATVAPRARPWYGMVCVLTAARLQLFDGAAPMQPLLRFLRPVLGRTWETADGMTAFAAAVPPHLRGIISGVEQPEGLWRAEARFGFAVEDDGFRLLHGSLPGAEVVLGALAVLAVDAWRVRVALTAATIGAGAGEVLDVMA